jgi:hypothetical protein
MINRNLWKKIENFDFDLPLSEYGFSTRLANENFWTQNFTQLAILEYKKFMYLAATNDFMVSPSEIVDIVWHQHLIFTVSYSEFCGLLGKNVQHIPSTHNKEDFKKFRIAKEKTNILYEQEFGLQPKSVWVYKDMFDSLNLEKSRFKLRSFIIVAIMVFFVLCFPIFHIVKPIYVKLGNPNFMLGYIGLIGTTLIAITYFNRMKLKQIVNEFDKDSFVFDLKAYELVYLQTQRVSSIVHGVVDELIYQKAIRVNENKSLEAMENGKVNSIEQFQAKATLADLGSTFYPTLLKRLIRKPIFFNTANCMDAFNKYVVKSVKFNRLFYLNFCVFSILLMIGIMRIATGVLRDLPVTYITFFVVFFFIIGSIYLYRLTYLISSDGIPRIYKEDSFKKKEMEGNWQWKYFLFGSSMLTPAFLPLVKYVNNPINSGDGCGSACGSSCGSSCGGGCGGCGGGGD